MLWELAVQQLYYAACSGFDKSFINVTKGNKINMLRRCRRNRPKEAAGDHRPAYHPAIPTGMFCANGVKANLLFRDAKPASKDPWTKEVWVYDYRTDIHHTLKKNPLKLEDLPAGQAGLQDFINCYNPVNRHLRKETWSSANPDGRFRRFTCEEIIARDKGSLNNTWLKDKNLADLENLLIWIPWQRKSLRIQKLRWTVFGR